MDVKMIDRLIDSAAGIRASAYSPYSHFQVGAALLTKSGQIFAGCNVENVSLGLTMCAEQGAISAAIAAGETDFVAIAVVADSKEVVLPCGRCRQILAEFNPEMEIVSATLEKRGQSFRLSDLLPRAKQGILESLRNDGPR